jgi:hypothetical protein
MEAAAPYSGLALATQAISSSHSPGRIDVNVFVVVRIGPNLLGGQVTFTLLRIRGGLAAFGWRPNRLPCLRRGENYKTNSAISRICSQMATGVPAICDLSWGIALFSVSPASAKNWSTHRKESPTLLRARMHRGCGGVRGANGLREGSKHWSGSPPTAGSLGTKT